MSWCSAACVLALSLSAACGGSTKGAADNPAAPGDGGTGGTASQGVGCPTDAPPGAPFTFRVKNAGTAAVTLFLGCGENPPIAVHLADGDHGIGAESAEFCGISCNDTFVGGSRPGACTDCGGGYWKTIQPGSSEEIAWDRRIWMPGPIERACSEDLMGSACAMGVAVKDSTISGTLEYCATPPQTLSCADAKKAAFSANLELGSVEITLP